MKVTNFRLGISFSVVYLLFLCAPSAQNNPFVSSPAAPSPGAASLGEQSNIPVNLYSGKAQIGVPLFHLESDHADLPVRLGYSSDGIKVTQMASEVGLGWGLAAGGTIVRSMNGIPDDCHRVSYGANTPSYPNAGYLHGTGDLIEDLYQGHPSFYSNTDKQTLWKGKKDTEPDVFFFNFGNYSGQFVFDKNGKVKLLKDATMKIQYEMDENLKPEDDTPGLNFSSPFTGGITQFTITTPDGMQYVFAHREIAYSKTTAFGQRDITPCDPGILSPYSYDFNYSDPNSPAMGYISAWHLSRVINPFGNQVFTLQYDKKELILDHTSVSQASDQVTLFPQINDCEGDGVNGFSNLTDLTYFTETATIKPRLSAIKYGQNTFTTYGRLKFVYNSAPRSDVYYPQNPPFGYNYVKSASLNRIEWLDSNNTKLKEYGFEYSYFPIMSLSNSECVFLGNDENGLPVYDVPSWLFPSFLRLRLDGIVERSTQSDGTVVELPPYTFTYNAAPMPPRLFPHQDFWGYYNGGTGTQTMFPTLYAYPNDAANNSKYQSIYSVFPRTTNVDPPVVIAGADRSANENAMKIGMLEKITYPTGGYSSFSYSAHQFVLDGAVTTGGGLRIDEIILSDGNGNDQVRSFEYFNGGTTSGKLINYPRFGRYKGCLSACNPSNIADDLNDHTAVYSEARTGFGTTYGTPVGYTRVVENQGSNGRVAYMFNLTAYAGVESADNGIYERAFAENNIGGFCQESKFPFPQNPNYDWSNGLLMNIKMYATDNTLVKEVENIYDWVEHERIYSVNSYVVILEGPDPDIEYVAVGKTFFLSGDKRLTKTISTFYGDDGNTLVTTRHIDYDSNYGAEDKYHFPTASWVINSDGREYRTEYVYTFDAQGDVGWETQAIQDLRDAYRVAIPMRVIEKIDGVQVGGKKVRFKTTESQGISGTVSITAPHELYEWGTTDWILRTTLAQDIWGFTRRVERPGFNPTIYNWINGRLMFKIENSNGADGFWRTDYGYNDAKLLTSVTDPNSQTISYQYDEFLRLHKTITKNGAVENTTTYNMGGTLGNTVSTFTEFGDSYANQTETQTMRETYDGLGRFLGLTAVNHGTNYANVILGTAAYDDQGREYLTTDLKTGSRLLTFDGSPLGRVRSIGFSSPGTIDYEYKVNASAVAGYAPGTLFEVITYDENDHPTKIYKDKVGRDIAKIDAEGGVTSYVYDAYNRVDKILPPGAQIVTPKLFYDYDYDERNRMIRRVIPGAGATEFVYNIRDEVVFSRDEKMLAQNRWMAFEYDDFSRQIRTGFYTGNVPPTSNDPDPEYLTHSAYDQGVGATIGKLVSFREVILNPDGTYGDELHTEYQYDDFGRLINTIADNHLGGVEITGTSYDNADKVLTKTMNHSTSSETASLLESYGFDNGGRQSSTVYSINSEPSQLITYGYTAKDQLREKNIHGRLYVSGWPTFPVLQSIDYSYNQRGWLTAINGLNLYAKPQNRIPTCNGPNVVSCLPEIDVEIDPCDEKCGTVEIDMNQLLKLRLIEEDIRLNCYTPCECDNKTKLPAKPDCDAEGANQQGLALNTLYQKMAATTVDSLSFPSNLYRVKLCGGKEMHLTQDELPILDGDYRGLQTVPLANAAQNIQVRRENGADERHSLSSVLSLRQTSENIKLEGYDQITTPPQEQCDFDEPFTASAVSQSTLFSNYFGDSPYLDLTTAYDNADQSLEDNGASWFIQSVSRYEQEAEWTVGYDFGTYTGVNITSYSIFLEADFLDILPKSGGVVRLALFDGNSLVNINGGSPYLEINSQSNSTSTQTFTLTPDVLPTRAQAENMRLAIMHDYWLEEMQIQLVGGQIAFGTQCQDNCSSSYLSCSQAEIDAQRLSLANLRVQMANLDISNLPIPNRLYRLRFCDNSELNVFQSELSIITGNYVVLDEIAVEDVSKTFLVGGNVDRRDLFALSINYFSSDSEVDAVGQRNGNIASMKWQVAKQSIKSYGFQYDRINRLKKAKYAEYYYDLKNGICEVSTDGRYDVWGDDGGKIGYDARGNITSLKRNGVLGGCGNGEYSYGLIDDLDYDYYLLSNQLESVDEAADTDIGFRKGLPTGVGYLYDENGNMRHDPHKNISITYNHLNLPVRIASNDGTIEFWYTATGLRLKKQVVDASGGTTVRDYTNMVEYVNGQQESIHHSNGRAIVDAGGLLYQYFINDHLGNTRIAFADLNNDGIIEVGSNPGDYTEIMQENHYYPYGMKMDGPWSPTINVEHPYQYNGIDFESALKLDVNIAKYRTLDPSIGRWWNVDPKAESFVSITPYNSMGCNPISFKDPDGDEIVTFLTAVAVHAIFAGATKMTLNAIGGKKLFKGVGRAALAGAVTGAITHYIGASIPGEPLVEKILISIFGKGFSSLVEGKPVNLTDLVVSIHGGIISKDIKKFKGADGGSFNNGIAEFTYKTLVGAAKGLNKGVIGGFLGNWSKLGSKTWKSIRDEAVAGAVDATLSMLALGTTRYTSEESSGKVPVHRRGTILTRLLFGNVILGRTLGSNDILIQDQYNQFLRHQRQGSFHLNRMLRFGNLHSTPFDQSSSDSWLENREDN
ncbi:MAG: RHS repeat-associated core domain-containing protein [Bacteroidota bacterium]